MIEAGEAVAGEGGDGTPTALPKLPDVPRRQRAFHRRQATDPHVNTKVRVCGLAREPSPPRVSSGGIEWKRDIVAFLQPSAFLWMRVPFPSF